MSAENYLQFPLCGLALPDDALMELLISFAYIEAGSTIMEKLSTDERRAKCEEFGLWVGRCKSMELVARLGAQLCGVTPGNIERSLKNHQLVSDHRDQWQNRHGNDPIVRIKKHLMFQIRDEGVLSRREFRVLAAIYSSIGRNPFRAIPEPVIRVRAAGCKCADIYHAEADSLPPLLTEKQVRLTVARLHEIGWFARVTPIRYGRKTYYSHRLTDPELRERLLISLTYAHQFAAEQRTRNIALAKRIAEAKGGDTDGNEKGDYNSTPAEGRQEGDAKATEGVTEGRQEGDYNINTLGINADGTNAVETNTCGTTSQPTTVGEEGYQVDGMFIPIDQANVFAAANRDRILEIAKSAKRARRAQDGTVTLIDK